MSQLFRNKYGYFDGEKGEYVITRPDTPRPWSNILSNGTYGMTITQAGSGYSWQEHAQFNRLFGHSLRQDKVAAVECGLRDGEQTQRLGFVLIVADEVKRGQSPQLAARWVLRRETC